MAQMNLTPLEEVLDNKLGKEGTPVRDCFESEVKESLHAYRIGEAIKRARQEQDLTQEEYSWCNFCLQQAIRCVGASGDGASTELRPFRERRVSPRACRGAIPRL